MSKSLFTLITAGEMDTVLSEAGFQKVEMTDGTKEAVYEFPHQRLPHVVVRIYTSISDLMSRGCGEDAIRVILFDKRINKAVAKGVRTHRIVGWQDRMLQKARDLYLSVKSLKTCCKCGMYLVERTNSKTNEKFLGCSNYPQCK